MYLVNERDHLFLASFSGPFKGGEERAWYTPFAHAHNYYRKVS